MPAAKAAGAKKAPAAKAVPRSSNRSVVTGVSVAWVNGPAGPVPVNEGEEIPAGVTPEEIERLASLNVFGEHKRVAGQRQLDEMVRLGLASVSLKSTVEPEPEAEIEEDPDNDLLDNLPPAPEAPEFSAGSDE